MINRKCENFPPYHNMQQNSSGKQVKEKQIGRSAYELYLILIPQIYKFEFNIHG